MKNTVKIFKCQALSSLITDLCCLEWYDANLEKDFTPALVAKTCAMGLPDTTLLVWCRLQPVSFSCLPCWRYLRYLPHLPDALSCKWETRCKIRAL